MDLKYGITSNLWANLTVDTDFADADVDPLRLNPVLTQERRLTVKLTYSYLR